MKPAERAAPAWLALAALALAGGGLVAAPGVAQAATPGVFVVDSADDLSDASANGVCATSAGTCTLRAALTEANRFAGHATVTFALPGDGITTVRPATRLPGLTNPAGITVDGYTQPGSAPNTAEHGSNARIRVQVEGKGAQGFHGFVVNTPDNVVRGLAVYNFRLAFQLLDATAANNQILGNFICTDAEGVFRAPAVNGGAGGVLMIQGPHHNVVGSPQLADRNVISGCAHRGVILQYVGTTWNKIQNNVVGLNPAGTAALPNLAHGIDANYSSQDNLIGGWGPRDGNVSSGNGGVGIEVSHGNATKRNHVIGNSVGTDVTGTRLLPYTGNASVGVHLEGEYECDPCAPNAGWSEVAGNTIVGNGGGILIDKGQQYNRVHDNRIGVLPDGSPGGNLAYGARIEHGSVFNVFGPNNILAYNARGLQLLATGSGPPTPYLLPARRNTITANSIFANQGLGIDLAPLNQPNLNGNGTPDVQDNVQGPVIRGANQGSMTGTACPSCTVEAFLADATGVSSSYTLDNFGEGQTYLSSTKADAAGVFTFDLTPFRLTSGAVLTASVTDLDGNSSEFAKNVVVGGPRAPQVTAASHVSAVDAAAYRVSGTATSSATTATAVLTDATGARAQTTGPVAGGAFDLRLHASALADGPLTLGVTLLDDAGQRSPEVVRDVVKDTVPAAVLSASPAGGSTVPGATSVVVQLSEPVADGAVARLTRGTADVAGSVELSADRTTVVFTPGATLSTGAHRAVVTVQDAAGNPTTSDVAFTVDATAPAAPGLQVPASITTGAEAVRVSGTTEPAATVTVVARDASTSSRAVATADASGAWSTTIDLAALQDGPVDVSATAGDAYGNVSDAATARTTKDTRGPVLVSSRPAPGAVVAGGDVAVTFDRPVADGWSFTVSRDGAGVAGTSSRSADGTTLTFVPSSPLGSGEHAVAVRVTGQTGNPGTASFRYAVDVDAPAAPTLVLPSAVTAANAAAVPVSGTAETGARVVVTAADGATSRTTTLTAQDGRYAGELDVTGLADGPVRFTATARDAVGNTGAAATASLTKTTRADAPGVTGISATVDTATLSWSAPAETGGAPVLDYRVTLLPTTGTPTQVTTTGLTATATGLAEGTHYSVTVAARTSAGYGASASARTVTTLFRAQLRNTPSATTVTKGSSITISGVMSRPLDGAGISGKRVILWSETSTGVKTRLFTDLLTDSRGAFSKTIVPTATQRYYTTFTGDAAYAFAKSPPTATVTVK